MVAEEGLSQTNAMGRVDGWWGNCSENNKIGRVWQNERVKNGKVLIRLEL